ncbi:hypothetical protein HDN1F_37760 [gamma proteobacterium HdN1]|nr:hypothetical protein HDN1F_37760 [gamma proteobacterium HdN1]
MAWRSALFSIGLLMIGALCGMPTFADEIIATGESALASVNGNRALAREAALKDAYRNALLQSGVAVDSTMVVHNGMLQYDNTQLSVSGSLGKVRILGETLDEGIYRVTIAADASARPGLDCTGRQAPYKSVLFTRFPLQKPEDASVGALFDADIQVPKVLAQRVKLDCLKTLQQVDVNLLDTASETSPDPDMLRQLAETRGVQFIVTGEIQALALVDPEEFRKKTTASTVFGKTPSAWVESVSGKENRNHLQRNFGLRVQVYDGFSGGVIFDRTYRNEAEWEGDYTEKTGYGSARFNSMAYGKMAERVLNQVAADISQKVDAQPFIAAMERGKEGNLFIHAGANSGLQRGDRMEIYFVQWNDVPGVGTRYDSKGGPRMIPRLVKEGKSIEITEIFPEYSVAKDPGINSNNLNVAVVPVQSH